MAVIILVKNAGDIPALETVRLLGGVLKAKGCRIDPGAELKDGNFSRSGVESEAQS